LIGQKNLETEKLNEQAGSATTSNARATSTSNDYASSFIFLVCQWITRQVLHPTSPIASFFFFSICTLFSQGRSQVNPSCVKCSLDVSAVSSWSVRNKYEEI
jgi:hypothetical protein